MSDINRMFSVVCDNTFKAMTEDALMPTRYCAVCEKREFENSIVCKDEFWLCDGCLAKLKKLLKDVKE